MRGDAGEVRAQLGGREGADRSPDHVAERQVEAEVQRHEAVDTVERSGAQHRPGTTPALLGRLEQEAHGPREVRVLLQPFGECGLDRDVPVVAARVHGVVEGGAEADPDGRARLLLDSSIGSASVSKRSAHTGPGRLPSMSATRAAPSRRT